MMPAVFLDRDGVLNRYLPGDYVKTPDELAMLPGAADAARRLNALGFPVLVVSNQQGVAKGVMTEGDLRAIDAKLHAAVEAAGGGITQSFYCTHRSADNCACRKPKPGMILEAAATYDLDLAGSVFVGDTETDAQAARAAGVGAFVLVLSGKFAGVLYADHFPVPPDFVAADLAEAVEWIARRGRIVVPSPL